MSARGVERVRIGTIAGTVEISLLAALELQARLLRYKTTSALVSELQGAETGAPIVIDEHSAGPLLVELAQWAKEVGRERLPSGIPALRDLLESEVGWEEQHA